MIATTYVNMAISTAILRDQGVLERMQDTPLPTWAYVAARIGSTTAIVGVMTVLILGLGVAEYGVTIHGSTLLPLIVVLVLGTAAFTTLGIGIARFIPTAESVPVFVNLSVLPLTFISSIWFPTDGMPHGLQTIAKLFPIRALADGLQYAFDPHAPPAPSSSSRDIRTLVIWTAVGIAMMVRFLKRPQEAA